MANKEQQKQVADEYWKVREENDKLKEQLKNEHENFLSVHRNNGQLLERIFELEKALKIQKEK